MKKTKSLLWKTIIFGVFLSVFTGETLALDQSRLREYETLLLVEAGYADVETLLTESEKLAAAFSLEEPSPETFFTALRLGILYHNLSLHGAGQGHRGYAQKAVTVLTGVYHHQEFPEELRPIGGAYLGSSLTLAGNEAINPVMKIKYVRDGLKYLDAAVKKNTAGTPISPFSYGPTWGSPCPPFLGGKRRRSRISWPWPTGTTGNRNGSPPGLWLRSFSI